ncbi:MAG: HAMP domain-containing histidine kinase [Alphaproteobacteria bacterium]|nr:HAMP domain-containing histidine kinase [Alphaproteobacteria bacterium]
MSPHSLRLRLMFAAALSALVTLALIGFLIANLFERQVESRVREFLSLQLDQLAGHLTVKDDGTAALDAELSDPRYMRPLSGLYWEVDEEGKPPLRSRSSWDQSFDFSANGRVENFAVTQLYGPKGVELVAMSRAVSKRDKSDIKHHYFLTIAQDTRVLVADRAQLLKTLAIALGFAFFAIVAAAAAQIYYGLKPLEAMRRDIERVRGGLSDHVETQGVPSEVLPLAEEINTTLGIQHRNLERARRQAGDLAHGLKTPIAALAGQADLLARAGLSEEAEAIRGHLRTMNRHVERELARARAQGEGAVIGTGVVPIVGMRSIVSTLQKLPREPAIEYRILGPEIVSLAMNDEDFAEVTGNLIDNARKWANRQVVASFKIIKQVGVITIEDDGPGISPNHQSAALARGGRLDEKVQGSGLGLSIVEAVLENYGSKLELGRSDLGGLKAAFKIPLRKRVL